MAAVMEVWHVDWDDSEKRERKMDWECGLGPAPAFPEDYHLVARVPGDDLDHAYERTNSISCAWFRNEGVEVVKETRSTSVGDVVVLDGVPHRCISLGWGDLEAPARPR